MNRAQRRAAGKRRTTANEREIAHSRRIIDQLYLHRYTENAWWRMTTGWGFRGIVPKHKRALAHNLALELPLHWHAVSITYLEDPWGKRYKVFGFARSNQSFQGFSAGICPLLDQALTEAEESVNTRQVYARGMVFAPWSKRYDSLLPILKLKQRELRLSESDLEELARAEDEWKASPAKTIKVHLPDLSDIDDQIAELLKAS